MEGDSWISFGRDVICVALRLSKEAPAIDDARNEIKITRSKNMAKFFALFLF